MKKQTSFIYFQNSGCNSTVHDDDDRHHLHRRRRRRRRHSLRRYFLIFTLSLWGVYVNKDYLS